MPTFDVYTKVTVVDKRNIVRHLWNKTGMLADDADDIARRIEALRTLGDYCAYPEETCIVMRAHKIETVEFERVR